MVLILLGRNGPNHVHNIFWEILYQSFTTLITEDPYEVHFYAPSMEELERKYVKKEGSFEMEIVEMYGSSNDAGNCPSYGVAVAKAVRSIQESMIVHFGVTLMLDKLFHHYANLVDRQMLKEDNNIRCIIIALLLTKLH